MAVAGRRWLVAAFSLNVQHCTSVVRAGHCCTVISQDGGCVQAAVILYLSSAALCPVHIELFELVCR